MADPWTLALGGAGIVSNYLQGKAANEANMANVAAQKEQNEFMRDLINSGVIDAFGNRIGVREGGTGPLTTELVGDSKTLADTGMANALAGEGVRGQFTDVAGNLTGQFSGIPPARAPLSLSEAQNIVDADDNRLKNAILNPALQNAQMLAQRTGGDSTGTSQLVTNFQERILPQIQLGGKQKAMQLADADRQRFTGETLGLGEKTLGIGSSGYQPTLPGQPQNLASQAINRISTPITQPNLTGAGLASGVGNLAGLVRSDNQLAEQNKLISTLANRMLPDQGKLGGN